MAENFSQEFEMSCRTVAFLSFLNQNPQTLVILERVIAEKDGGFFVIFYEDGRKKRVYCFLCYTHSDKSDTQ